MKKIVCVFFVLISVFVFSQKILNIKFYNEKVKDGFVLYADNSELTPVSTVFNFTLKNMTSSLKNSETIVIPAGAQHFLLAKIKIIDPRFSYRYDYKNSYNFGDTTQRKYDDDYILRPTF